MRSGFTSDLEIECRRPDSRVRTFIDAEIEVSSDVRRRRAQWMLADGVVLRTHDFPASSALTAAAQTTALTLANAPAGNDLYEVHFSVQITPVIPGAGTNTHVVEVAIDTRPAAGAWTERAAIRYEVLRTAGQNGTIVRWAHEDELVRLTGLISTSEIRLRVKSATGPIGWSFVVHGFNLATNADAVAGVNYHTGLAVDFPADGGVALADKVKTLIQNAVSDGYQTDLDGSYASAAASPFLVARLCWGKDDVRDIPLDRFVAYLNPRVDGGQPRNVYQWLMRPYAVTYLGDRSTSSGNAWNQTQVDPLTLINHLDARLVPLGTTLGVYAQDGDSPEEITFSWATKTDADKPHPKRYGVGGRPGAPSNGHPITLFLIWAIQRDGTPATNVGWGQDSATSEIISGSRGLRTVQLRMLDLNGDWVLETPELGAANRAVVRCRVESGDYPSTATVAFTGAGAGSRFALATVPTKTVQFICRADVPPGSSAVFQVRNDADSGWLTVTDGQTTDDLAIAKNQTRKGQVILTSTPNLDATPIVFEFGMRELTIYPLHFSAKLLNARWAVDPLQLVAETTNARLVLPRDPKNPFDRVTAFLKDYFIGQITIRVWVGTPERPRWLHIDDFLIDDEEAGEGEVGIPALGVTCLERGTLPVFDSVTETASPLVYANKTLQFAYNDILTKIGVSGRFLGEGIQDNATLVSKTLTESEAKQELDALNFLDGSARISSQGRIKSVRIFGDKATVRTFPRERIKWASVTPGYRQRAPEVRIPWQWSDTESRYQSEHKAVNANAVLRLGRARIDPPQLLPDVITRWINSAALADKIGKRHVSAFGAGMMLWFFEVDTPEPQLEPGDCVSLPTDLFVGRDPMTDRPVSGEVDAVGVIAIASEDFRTFGYFVRSWSDIAGGTEAGTRVGYGVGIESASFAWSRSRLTAALAIRYVGLSGCASVKIATSTASLPTPGTGTVVDGQTGELGMGKFFFGAHIYVTITPYGSLGGTGVQGPEYQMVLPPESVAGDFASSAYTHSGLSAFDATKVENLDYADQAWHTDAAVAGAWLQIDTGAGTAYAFAECRIYAQVAGYAGVYDIEYADAGGGPWTAASTGFKPMARGLNSRNWPTVGAHRFWRIKLTNTPGASGWLSELDFVTGLPSIIIEKPVPFDGAQERSIRTIDDTLERFRAIVKESGNRAVNLLYAKPLVGDPDTLNSVIDGATYGKTLLTALTTNQVDLSKAGVIAKYGTNIQRDSGNATKLDTIVAKVADTGDLASTMLESGGRAVNLLFAKALVGDPDTLNSVPDGTTYARILGTRLVSGAIKRAGAYDDGSYALVSSATDGLTADANAKESGAKKINLLYAKALASDPDHLDSVADGTTYKRIVSVASGQVTQPSIGPDVIQQIANIGVTVAVNGDYEEGVKNWRVASASGLAHTMESTTSSPIEGAKSCKITVGGAGTTSRVQQCDRQTDVDDSTGGNPLYIPVQPLDEVWGTVKVNIGLLSTSYLFRIEEYDSAKSLIQRTTLASKTNISGAATFQLFGGVVLQATTRYIVIIHEYPGSFTDNTGTFKVDAVQLYRIPAKQRCHAYRSAAKAITTATPTAIDWDTETSSYDIGSMHDVSTNKERITVQAAAANRGVIRLFAQIQWAAGTTGYRKVQIRKNGGTVLGEVTQNGTNTIETTQQCTAVDNAPAAADYYEVIVTHTQGANLNVNNGQWVSYFQGKHEE